MKCLKIQLLLKRMSSFKKGLNAKEFGFGLSSDMSLRVYVCDKYGVLINSQH